MLPPPLSPKQTTETTAFTAPFAFMADSLNGDAVTASNLLSWPRGSSVARGVAFARRLGSIHVSPSDDLQMKLNNANAGDTLILADGTDLGSGNELRYISKDITIRAQNFGQAILHGQGARRVIRIAGGHITLEGLGITGGHTVRCPCPAAILNLPGRSFDSSGPNGETFSNVSCSTRACAHRQYALAF